MEKVFLSILNMSITSSYVILFVLLARVFLKKAPRIFSYTLWSVVLFRLICPFSFSSALSFFGFFRTRSMEHNPGNLGYVTQPQVNVIDAVNNWSNSSLPAAAPAVSVAPKQIIMFVISMLWIIGVISLLIYSCVSYIHLKRKVSTSVLVSDNILKCENIKSPFVLGIIKPRIYLPVGLTENEESYILLHEQIHIKRFDYLIKPAAFIVSCIHWFNPLVWISFVMMSRDMEMSCDEGVLRKMGKSIKKDYSSSILALSFDRRMLNGSPLAFGESNAKGRIKNVLSYKKPGFWVIIAAVILVGVAGVGLAANPKVDRQKSEAGVEITENMKEDKQKDVPFLNIKNIISEAAEREQLLIRESSGAAIITGSEFSGYLNMESSGWIDRDAPINSKLTPDLRVYLSIGSNYKLNLYKSEPELAQVIYGEYYRYYKIPKDTYEKLYLMYLVRSYHIPNTVMSAIADGKMTNMQSVQDVPNNGDCKVLKVGSESYYIYEKSGKYYVEQPYQFISEITEKVYKDAIVSTSITSGFPEQKVYEIPSKQQKDSYSVEDFNILYSEYLKLNNLESQTSPENDKTGMSKEDKLKYYTIYDITPKNVKEEIGCQLFKINYTCETYVVYNSKVYAIGFGFGGYGVVSMETCDFDDNGQKDLIYTFSWGSGIHRSHIGVFNFSNEQEVWLDFQQMNKDIMLKKISDNCLKVYITELSTENLDFTHLKLSKKNHIADVKNINEKIGVIKYNN